MKGLIFTYLLTYGGALASLVNPFVGLIVYVAFAVLRPQSLWSFSLPQGGRYSLIVALALLAGWAMQGFGSWKFGSAKSVIYALLVFWLWLVISATTARDTSVAWPFVETMSKGFLPCIVALTLIDSVQRLKALAWVIVLSQGYLAYEFNTAYFQYGFNDGEWSFAGVDNNGMAIAMVSVIGTAFFLGLHSKRWWQKGIAFLAAALMVHFVLFSMSRGGMLALVVMGGVIFWIIPKNATNMTLFCIGVAVGLRLAGPAVVEEFMSIKKGDAQGVAADEEAFSRTLLWKACIKVGLDNPVSGVGPANWRVIAHEYGFTRGKASHTTWFNVLAEEGVPGFLSLVSFFGLCVVKLWPIARGKRPVADPWLRYLAGGVCASIIGFCISAQFVAIEGLEIAYFTGILGAGVLKVESLLPAPAAAFSPVQPLHTPFVNAPTRPMWY